MNAKGAISIRDEVGLRKPTSTRLTRRGVQLLSAADEVSLVVVSFAANEESIYVMSLDWDADAFPRGGSTALGVHNDYSGMWDHLVLPVETYEQWTTPTPYQWDNEKRLVILYEFDCAGHFRKKLVLPLIKLQPEWQSDIRARRPGKPIVGEHMILFHELLRIRGWSRLVRIDYIFDLQGKLLAVWSNESFFDKFKLEGEPSVPYGTVIKSGWVVGDYLVCCQPEGYLSRHDLMCDLSMEYHRDERYQLEHIVGLIHLDEMVRSYRSAEAIDYSAVFPDMLPTTEFMAEPAQLYRSQFPEPSAFVAHKTYQKGWDKDASTNEAVWFFHGMYGESDWAVWYMQILPSVAEPIAIEIEPPMEELLEYLVEADVDLHALVQGIAVSTDEVAKDWRYSPHSFVTELRRHDIGLFPSDFSVHDGFVCIKWSLRHGAWWGDFWIKYSFNPDIWSLEPRSLFTIGSDASRMINELVSEEWGAPLSHSVKEVGQVANGPYDFDNHTASGQFLLSRFVTRDSSGKPIVSARTGMVMTDIATGWEKSFIPRVPMEMRPKFEWPNHIEY